MEKTKNKGNIIAAVIAVSVIAFFALVLIIPASREVFKSLSSSHPYIMGFLKFGLLASCGEIFALRIKRKSWAFPNYFHFRALIWGAIGIAITFMMKVYTYGVVGMMEHGLLPALKNTESFWNSLLRAFFTAAVMNLTFGPTFMAFHKCTDTYLDLLAWFCELYAPKDDTAVLDTGAHRNLYAPCGISGDNGCCAVHSPRHNAVAQEELKQYRKELLSSSSFFLYG